MIIHRNFILSPNSRDMICPVISRREAAYPSAGMAGPMDPKPAVTAAFPKEGPSHA